MSASSNEATGNISVPVSDFEQTNNNNNSDTPQSSSQGSEEDNADSSKIIKEMECAFTNAKSKGKKRIKLIGKEFAKMWKKLKVKVSPTERAHFYSQIGTETSGLENFKEKNPGQSKIKGGQQYYGRGPMQLTHSDNYNRFSGVLSGYNSGKNLESLLQKGNTHGPVQSSGGMPKDKKGLDDLFTGFEPKQITAQALSAVWYWENKKKTDKKFASAAKQKGKSAVSAVTKGVNGGQNALAKREKLFNKALGCLK